MAKYEYFIMRSKDLLDDDERELDRLGRESWLLVGVDNFHSSTQPAKYILMREIED